MAAIHRRVCRALTCLAFACVPLSGAAQAASGGISAHDPAPAEAVGFGERVLRLGMTGDDVRVLNGIVRSKPYGGEIRLTRTFGEATKAGVRLFQDSRGLRPSGIVDAETAEQLIRSMPRGRATWYGPGLYGNTTACGQTFRATTIGVAHKTLPCGTVVTVAYGGRWLITKVIDRGPYNPGYSWDLTNGARQALGFEGVGEIRAAVARR